MSATISVTGNCIAESAVNVLDTVLELQQLLAGSATSFTEFALCEAGSATRFTEFLLYEAESAVRLKVESTFDSLPNPVFCVVCSFVASLSNAMASPREGSWILCNYGFMGCMCLWVARSVLADSSESQGLPEFCTCKT